MIWQSIVCCAAFVATNVVIWTLDISDGELFLATAPLGLAYFPGIVWLYAKASRR